MSLEQKYTLRYAQQLDIQDELSRFRNEFYLHDDIIYLDGNSLGLLSKRAEAALMQVLEDWKHLGIDGWTSGAHPWFYLSDHLSEKLAPLIGASAQEVVVTGSTTVNLHQLIAAFYRKEGARNKILTEELAFPSDIYAIESQISLHGDNPKEVLIKVSSRNGYTLHEEDIIEKMSDNVSLIILPAVLYRSGQILDMKRLTKEAHKRNIIIGFDLAHSIGALPHQLSDWDADFAFWCNYKHLNGGPGAVGGLYVNKRHFGTKPGLAGWFGSDKQVQFDMSHEFIPADDAKAFQIGTPHILSMAPIIGSLAMFEEAGMEKIREKSLKLTGYFLELIQFHLSDARFMIQNPLEEEKRGGHILLEHPEAARICKALKKHRIIPDFRHPNGIRIAPVALYNSYSDCWHAVMKLKEIMDDKLYLEFKNEREIIA